MDFWNQAPFLRLILPLIAGVIAGIEYSIPLPLMLGILLPLLLLTIVVCLRRLPLNMLGYGGIRGILVYSLMFFGGWALTDASEDIRSDSHFSRVALAKEADLYVRIIEPPQPKERSLKMVVQVENVARNGEWVPTTGRMLLYFQKDSSVTMPRYGDYLYVHANIQEIEEPRNPAQFDYQRHLRNKHIHHQSFVKSGAWIYAEVSGGNPLYHFAFDLRDGLLASLEDVFDDPRDLAVASALMLGYKEKLDRDVLLSYSSSGAMHVLAVSGLHVGIIFLVLDLLLRFMDYSRRLRLLKAVCIISGLWIYAMLTGLSPSVERSALMFTFIVIGKLIGRSTSVYNTLSASAFLLILLNPYIITEVGFQLSYIAVLGIVFIQPRLYNVVYVKNKWLDKIWAITCVSIAAQIATFPLGIYYFHQFPNYFLISNLFVIPMASVILYAGFVFFLSLPFGGVINEYAVLPLKYSIVLLNEIVRYIEQLPYALTYGISATITELLLMYFVVIAIMTWFRYKIKFMLYVGLTFIVALLAYQFSQVQIHNSQQIFVVFDVKNTSAYNVIHGRHSYLIADEGLLEDEEKKLFYMRHFWFERRTYDELLIPIDADTTINQVQVQDHLLMFGGKTALIVDDRMNFLVPNVPAEVDYLILRKNARIFLKGWLEMVKCSLLIIDSSNKFGKAEYWQREAEKLGVAVHNVPKDGAYVEFY